MAIPKKVMNFCYGMGAAVVIVGALFKITHMEFGPLNGNNMLTVGLLVEALIFAISAFEPVDDEVDWALVYPELKGGAPRTMQVGGNVGVTGTVATTSVGGSQPAPAVHVQTSAPAQAPAYAAATQQHVAVAQPTMERSLLSEKLDNILKEAKIDGNLMESLRDSIKNFEAAAKGIAPTVDTVASSNRYAEEMAQAALQLESLNSMYKVQLESATKNADINREVAENNLRLKEQMMSLTSNLSTLNAVYGGMLSAMGKTAN
ncbi:gliding motility protein GldL [Flavobacterium sp. xlx-214]|uniref:type IX secretion system motor protein PorL/GldL n=1 Tax=unclassified Flavobacterium TaxID=196869 RepID=UPI0013D2901C|nr:MULTISPECIES: gliding motility protein GldL [unclassified Flavobacterium]MBA5793369.1 gliding motility protein GldL [Flavobacterium sp. xlx-221]QMI84069.1 gliding motility protein GldL [Flavobacterium sp. xlx-214]